MRAGRSEAEADLDADAERLIAAEVGGRKARDQGGLRVTNIDIGHAAGDLRVARGIAGSRVTLRLPSVGPRFEANPPTGAS